MEISYSRNSRKCSESMQRDIFSTAICEAGRL